MNRREALTALATGIAAAAVPGVTAGTVEAEPPPLLLTVKLSDNISTEQMQRLRESLHAAFQGKDHPPIVVLREGMDIQLLTWPR